MIRTAPFLAAILLALPLPVLAQETGDTVQVEDAPFKEAGSLAARLDAATLTEEGVYTRIETDAVTSDLLDTARVIDAAGNPIGRVSGLVLDTDERVDAIVVRVGGFLGTFQTPVRVPLSDAIVGRSDELNETLVVLDVTARELDAMPRFDQ